LSGHVEDFGRAGGVPQPGAQQQKDVLRGVAGFQADREQAPRLGAFESELNPTLPRLVADAEDFNAKAIAPGVQLSSIEGSEEFSGSHRPADSRSRKTRGDPNRRSGIDPRQTPWATRFRKLSNVNPFAQTDGHPQRARVQFTGQWDNTRAPTSAARGS